MTPKERLVCAIDRKKADRLPVTTHHVMQYFLENYLDGINYIEFFNRYKLDPIVWVSAEEFFPKQLENWRITSESVEDPKYPTTRFTIHTPAKDLTCTIQYGKTTYWLSEHMIKEKNDIEVLAKYMPSPHCNIDIVNQHADLYPDYLIRGHVAAGDIFGQPGCWQQAACLFGIEPLIFQTYDDPVWVRNCLQFSRK